MFIEVKGLKTEYIEAGEGIPVLLLHGWGSSFDVYKGIMSALSDRCRLVAVNFPGCGNTETMKEPWNLEDYCDFCVEFAEKTGLQNPILIGHSHGGRVILNMVAKKMMNPPKIVLLDSAGLISKKTFKQKLKIKTFKAIKKVLTLPIFKDKHEELLEKARKHFGSADYNAAPEVLRKTLVNVVNRDLRDIIPEISCPTLLIWGDKDTATPIDDAKTIEKLIPDAGLCVLEGTGHYSFCEKPFQAHQILRSFIK